MESALLPEGDDDDIKPSPPPDKSTLLSNLVESDSSHKLFDDDHHVGEADLFGSLDEPPAPAAVSDPLATSAPREPSKLLVSGLIKENGNEGGGGLFDDIDEMPHEEEPSIQQVQAVPTNTNSNDTAPSPSSPDEWNNNFNNSYEEPNSDVNLLSSTGGMGLGGSIPREAVHPPHPPPQQQQQPQVMNAMAGSYYYSTSGAGQMHYPPHHQQQHGSVLAGMHNAGGVQHHHQQQQHSTQPPLSTANHYNTNTNYNQQQHQQPILTSTSVIPKALTDYTPPPPFNSPYGKITVTEPMLIQGTGLFAGPPHWTYLVTLYNKDTNSNNNNHSQPISAVRRRFRHFLALETRLHNSAPGAILPPRPEKHPTRAIEEASARQSSEFAKSRCVELTTYMNALATHPYLGNNAELKLFLMLQDHIGTAWPEVSGSALTRITAVGMGSVEKLAEGIDGILNDVNLLGGSHPAGGWGEDNAELLALAAYEGRRIGAVAGSVPKIEGTVNILKDRGDRWGATGLEMSKLAKDVAWCDRELTAPLELLSSALLRTGRRVKRCGLEIASSVTPFITQYKLCKYEQMAFADRRAALKRRTEARGSADRRAAKVMMNQYPGGRLGSLEKMEMEAAMYDEMATEAAREAEEVASRLQNEVGRIGSIRVREWDDGVRAVACGMKEACAENAAIWEAALECFKREFPEVHVPEMADVLNGSHHNQTQFV